MTNKYAVIAATRFGWGVEPNLVERIASDPQSWVMRQINSEIPFPPEILTTQQSLAGVSQLARMRKNKGESLKSKRNSFNRLVRREAFGRVRLALQTNRPFLDRWVAFWSNHFTISGGMARTRAVPGAYERDAIRTHALGRFEDMLLGVISHPAMQIYLDNYRSVGPNSRFGKRRDRGLNENLGREILELHTLGANGGYDQRDVEELSLALTGWSVQLTPPSRPKREGDGNFIFRLAAHEGGTRRLLGRTYEESGREQAQYMLRDLALHPSTARHIATKICQHFVSDNPPASLIQRLENDFLQSGGDLTSLAKTLVKSEEAWQAPRSRFLPPFDYLIAAGRTFPGSVHPRTILIASAAMGQRLWAPPSPEGYSHENSAWLGPEGLELRLAFANRVADESSLRSKVVDYAQSLYGGGMDSALLTALKNAESARQGITLLLMSPTFLRR